MAWLGRWLQCVELLAVALLIASTLLAAFRTGERERERALSPRALMATRIESPTLSLIESH